MCKLIGTVLGYVLFTGNNHVKIVDILEISANRGRSKEGGGRGGGGGEYEGK